MAGSVCNEGLSNDDTETCLSILNELNMQAAKVFSYDKMSSFRISAERFLKKYNKSCGKDSARAKTKKEEGDDNLKKNRYYESLQLYTESIFLASRGDECLPLAYANRSLVLLKMNHLVESVVDIDMALESGYPKSNFKKLILRKAKCLVKLGHVKKAREVLTEMLDKKEIQKFIVTELKNTKGVSNQSVLSPEETLQKLAGGENENFAYASKYVSVHYNEAKGRYVVATEDIKPGDVLFVEKAFVSINRKSGCHNCFKKTVAPIPCWDCSDVSYCSPKCREEFTKSVHSFECGFAKLLESLGICHLSLRIVLSVSSSLEELKQNLKKISKPEIKDGVVLWKNTGYDRVYNLVHNDDNHEEIDMVFYAQASVILAMYLKHFTNYFNATGDVKDLVLVSSVILLHILQSICNGFTITLPLEEEEEEKSGPAIYPSVSMMNHSCCPSTVHSFVGKYIVVRAARAIKKGSEVFGCYGPKSTRMDRAYRQDTLSRQFFFQCECSDCLLEVDAYEIFTAFKCTHCKGPSITDKKDSERIVCVECGSTQEATELLHKRNTFYILTQDDQVENETHMMRLNRFLAGWRLGREVFYRFHKDLGRVADGLAVLLMNIGEFKRAIRFLRCSIRSVEVRFGSFSVELAEELKKLGGLYAISVINFRDIELRNMIAEDVTWYQRAEAIMTTLQGPYYEGLEEIKKYKERLVRMGF